MRRLRGAKSVSIFEDMRLNPFQEARLDDNQTGKSSEDWVA